MILQLRLNFVGLVYFWGGIFAGQVSFLLGGWQWDMSPKRRFRKVLLLLRPSIRSPRGLLCLDDT